MDPTIEALEKARVGDVFRSRKNRVFKVALGGETLVAKVFPPDEVDRALHEHSVLRSCVDRGVRVPRPVKQDGLVILMEYVEGRSAAESIDSAPSDAEEILRGVLGWLTDFHRAHGFRVCRGDSVLHNFIISHEGVAGIDFEESHEGDTLEDAGQVIASYLGMRPSFVDAKLRIAGGAAHEYLARSGRGGDRDVASAVSSALRHYAKYRDDGPLLRTWADRIERTGLASGKE